MSVFLHPGKIRENPAKLLRMLVCVLGIILLTSSCSTIPAKQTATAEAATNDAAQNTLADNEEELVCHYIMGTGSNIPRKVCAYEKTWEKYNKKTRENAEELTRKTRETGALTAPISPAEQSVGRGTVTGPMSP